MAPPVDKLQFVLQFVPRGRCRLSGVCGRLGTVAPGPPRRAHDPEPLWPGRRRLRSCRRALRTRGSIEARAAPPSAVQWPLALTQGGGKLVSPKEIRVHYAPLSHTPCDLTDLIE